MFRDENNNFDDPFKFYTDRILDGKFSKHVLVASAKDL